LFLRFIRWFSAHVDRVDYAVLNRFQLNAIPEWSFPTANAFPAIMTDGWLSPASHSSGQLAKLATRLQTERQSASDRISPAWVTTSRGGGVQEGQREAPGKVKRMSLARRYRAAGLSKDAPAELMTRCAVNADRTPEIKDERMDDSFKAREGPRQIAGFTTGRMPKVTIGSMQQRCEKRNLSIWIDVPLLALGTSSCAFCTGRIRTIASSIPLSISPSLDCLFPNRPMTLKAFRCDRFRFLPELFTISSRRFYHDLPIVKTSVTLHAPHRSVVVAFIGLVIQKVRMIWVPILGARAEFPDHTLALPSCHRGRIDQLALDCLCFNAGTLVRRLVSQNLDFVASQDPYDGDSTTLPSAIECYRRVRW
jgi:hypothetical protein